MWAVRVQRRLYVRHNSMHVAWRKQRQTDEAVYSVLDVVVTAILGLQAQFVHAFYDGLRVMEPTSSHTNSAEYLPTCANGCSSKSAMALLGVNSGTSS